MMAVKLKGGRVQVAAGTCGACRFKRAIRIQSTGPLAGATSAGESEEASKKENEGQRERERENQ